MRMKKAGLILLLFWFVLLIPTLRAITPNFRHYTVADGLSYNTVLCVIQDRQGFMWFGTDNGLNRFDGFNFKVYKPIEKTKNKAGSNVVTSLLEDAKGNIWVGTDAGIVIFNLSTNEITPFQVLTARGEAIGLIVNNLVMDHLGCIWISTYREGVFRYDPKEKKLDRYDRILDGNISVRLDVATQVYADSQNRVWVATKSEEKPLLLLDRKINCFRTYSKMNEKLTVYKFFEDSSHDMWLGTWNKGICKLNTETGQVTSCLSPEKSGGILHVHEINELRPGVLLIGSDEGLSIFDTKTFEHQLLRPDESDPTSISDKFIYPIYRDREGGIWIGTYFGGVNYLSPNSGLFHRYTHSRYKNSISGNVVGRFAEDKHGNIWIATDDGGLNMLNSSTGLFSAYLPKSGANSISYHNIHALCWDNDWLWIGTYSGGLNVLDIKTGRFKCYNSSETDPRSLDSGSIYAILKDNEGRIWVATMSGVNLYNRATDDFTRIKKLDVTTLHIVQDRNGFLWFATLGKGIYRFDPRNGQWKNYEVQGDPIMSLSSNQVNNLSFDDSGTMWAGTSNGLCLYDRTKDQFRQVDIDIPSKVICSIVPVGGDLWLTTAKGLVRYNIKTRLSQIFTQSDGLVSDQFIANSAFKSSGGAIYVGTANGFNSFDPKRLKRNHHVPQVAITSFEIFNKEVAVSQNGPLKRAVNVCKEIHLGYRDNVFSINFVALSYVTPEKNKYAYMLEGFDKAWNVVSEHKATYTNLPAGEYTFKVKAANKDGIWNEDGTQIKIIIHPPLWKTNFFKFIYFILFLGILFLLVRIARNRTERLHNEKMKELNQQKETEVHNAKINFFTMIAHEIRTPVTLIMGPIEKILNAADGVPQQITKDLNIIRRNSQRLLHLVNQLLDFRKIEQGSLRLNRNSNNIYQLLQDVWVRFIPIFEQNNIKHRFDSPDQDLEAEVDTEAITKAVSNLLTNAVKYTRDSIVLSYHKIDESRFEISVGDNGKGVPDSEKEKIFSPFYQILGESKEGTGIGLSLVKSIVDAHNGEVKVFDYPTGGVMFCLILPVENPNSVEVSMEQTAVLSSVNVDFLQNIPQEEVQLPDKSKNKPTLLIVEDNMDMRNFLFDNFKDEYIVCMANNGAEALAHLRNSEVDLIISDLMMPEMDGLEFCKQVRSNFALSHIPFVLLTAKNDLDSKIEGMNFGADSYVEKPFSIQFLKAQIGSLIENRILLRKKYSEMPFTPISTIAGNSADELFLQKLNTIIEENISNENFSIDQLAEQLHISRSGLFAKIKTLAGSTPNELIQLIRLKKAAEYISLRRHRINEIAFLVGFNNPSYFSKCFQKQFGVTPKEFESRYK